MYDPSVPACFPSLQLLSLKEPNKDDHSYLMDRLEVKRAILVDRSEVFSGNIYYSKRFLPNFTFEMTL